jgi:tyrosine-protein kinase Etk/Wzc
MDNGRQHQRTLSLPESEGITIKQLKALILKSWKVIAAFSIVGVVIAFGYNRVILPYYRISTTLLVKDDSKANELSEIFKSNTNLKAGKLIQDQIGVLKSYSLNLKAVQDFNWQYGWYMKGIMAHRDLYKDYPFEVILPPEGIQYDGVSLYVTPESETHYVLTCDSERRVNGELLDLSFTERIAFGEVFRNQFFNFGLAIRPDKAVRVGEEYVLKFNNLGRLAVHYKDVLNVSAIDENSNLIEVEMKTHQVQRDVDYLNKLGSFYIQYGLDEKNRTANNTVRFIDKLIEGVNVDLQVAGNVFTDFRAKNRTVDLGQEASAVVDQLKEIDRMQNQLNLRLDYYNNLKYYLDNKDEIKDLVAPTLVGESDESLNSLITKLNDLYSRREVLSYTVQAKNPTLVLLDSEINFTQKVLGEKVNSLIETTKLELRSLDGRQQRVNVELSRLPKTEQNFIGIKRNYDLNNELYNFLLQNRAEAEIARAANNPDAQILDPADVEIAELIGPIKWINLASGFAGGLFIALALLLAREYFSEKLMSVEQTAALLDFAVASPISHHHFKNEVPVLQYPKSAITESFRGLRINIQGLLKDQPNGVIAVHSNISGEGKSFVALNLALIFAVSGKRVLLIDGDLRRSRLHHVLKSRNDIGFISLLQGKESATRTILKTSAANLYFLPAGPTQMNPSELLNGPLLEQIVKALRAQFDYIVFDNAPIGVVNDAQMIGQQSDVNLFLLRLNHSGKDQVNFINRIYHERTLRHMMVAVNGVKQSKGYGYYNEDMKLIEDVHISAESEKEI